MDERETGVRVKKAVCHTDVINLRTSRSENFIWLKHAAARFPSELPSRLHYLEKHDTIVNMLLAED